ncbi:diguanylate cyclase (GGDEF)-like protein [Natronocella acetinitrilica]|jgi:diguanylate cyclase (GGDEF)-like protein|uniref:diguanylate cyclase n=1 Tax=Natronocella acetinitrilica TaxID=414046 RepID=A0AAE3G3N2_9GAMM|nr:diguanylate cyclase [Natronocella acetinitrilica]MCP1674807.1 diguanylate cyclase (GGDEF)-like protein [Natronocella acetinitrilica]
MDVNDPYVKVLDIEQTLAELNHTVDQLRQERDDLEIALTTAVEHGDAIESQLDLANRQLMSEVRERRAIEKQLRDLVATISQKSRDLEVVLQTITEHSDQMDLHWLGRYIESENIARSDPLTGLANRRMLDETMAKEWSRGRRRRQCIGMLLCDVDFFKSYNDRHGHQAGDVCLVRIADALRQELHREGDLIARYGGEEFVVLLPDTDATGVRRVAESIQTGFASLAIPHEDSPWGRITLSIGAAAMMPTNDNESALFAEVDRRLYVAKQQGRNRIVSAD